MKFLAQWWKSVSISRKLYLVVGVMAVLIAGELITLQFAMRSLSAVRAFVGGESVWSKAQKDAVFSLQRYSVTFNEKDYQAFLEHLKINEGDHNARLEMLKPNFDREATRQGFREGRIHPDDIDHVINLLRRFYWISYLSRAIKVWEHGDELLAQLRVAATDLHAGVRARDPLRTSSSLSRIKTLNDQLTPIEREFSEVLGEGSRWLEGLVNKLLFLAVLMVESFGLSVAFLTSRELSRGLSELTNAAERMGRGQLDARVPVRTSDEIGTLARSVNQMGEMLTESYRSLEERVRERTAELEKLASENSRLYEEAKAAVQTRDEFLSIASHELRTPLTSLSLQLQILAMKSRGVKKEEDLKTVEEISNRSLRAARRLTQLLDELLDLTRLRLGKLEIKRERCDLVPVVFDAVATLGAEAASKGSEIAVRAASSVNGEFDSLRMSQVVTNLVSNAIKYGNGNPIDVWVERQGNRSVVAVKDRGHGIPSDKLAQIFDRFERAEADAAITGLGLGLYITRQIVEAHGGKIRVDSEPGQGSTFVVELYS